MTILMPYEDLPIAFEVHRNFDKTCDFFVICGHSGHPKMSIGYALCCRKIAVCCVTLLEGNTLPFENQIQIFYLNTTSTCFNNSNKDGIFMTFQGGGTSSNPTVQTRKWTDFVPKTVSGPCPPTLSLDHGKSLYLQKVSRKFMRNY